MFDNRLTKVDYASGTDPAYTYGGDGNRRKKVDSSGTTWYNFSGIKVLSEETTGPDGGQP